MNGERFKRTHSVRVKYLVVLFAVIFLACGITYAVTFASMWGRINAAAEEQLQAVVDFMVSVMDRSGLSPEEVVDLVRDQVGEAVIYRTQEELPAPFNEGPMEPYRLHSGFLGSHFTGAARLPDGYLYVEVESDMRQVRQVQVLVLRTLLICAGIASVCAVIAIHRAIRPLRKLDVAIRQVARGDFDVSVDYQSRDEMGVVVQNFNWMVGELRNIEYLRKDFVSSVSHEFKTPIAAIRGGVKLLTSTPFDHLSEEKFRKYTGLIAQESDRMATLSSNLLRLSSLENQSETARVRVFSLDEQIRRAILLMEGQWSAKKLDLDIQLDRVYYRGDEELIQQVWINLLSNAVKFTAEGGNISVKLRCREGLAVAEIADDGVGMSEETQKRIFEKFYQGDRSHAREGNGLGMSIVKRILDLHHGSISYRSAPGEGTVCTVTLPQAESEDLA